MGETFRGQTHVVPPQMKGVTKDMGYSELPTGKKQSDHGSKASTSSDSFGKKRKQGAARWKALKAEQKRDAVVKAVLRLIATHGVQGTTTARIAAALGVSEPTIYRVFPSRRDMLLAAAQSLWQQRREELEAFVPTDAMDYLKKLAAHHTAGIQKTRVTRYLYELSVSRPSDGLREYLRGEMIAEAERLATIVTQGQKEGSIRADVDPIETAWRIMTVYWLEAMARLHGLEDILLSGFSTRFFDGILTDIAANPAKKSGMVEIVSPSNVKPE